MCVCVCVCVCASPSSLSGSDPSCKSHLHAQSSPGGPKLPPVPSPALTPCQSVPKGRLDLVQLKVGWTRSLPPLSLGVTVALELDSPPPIHHSPPQLKPSIPAFCTWQAVGWQRCGLKFIKGRSFSTFADFLLSSQTLPVTP